MYNHYLDGLDDSSFVLLEPESQDRPHSRQNQGRSQNRQNRQGPPHSGGSMHPSESGRSKNDLVRDVTRGLGQLLDGVMKHFSLEHFDTGDILLVLIILFLYLEDGDNLELVITLGLLLLLGLDGKTREADT